MPEKSQDLGRRRDEIPRQVGKGRLAHHDKQRDPMADDGGKLIGLVAYARVVRYRDPTVGADRSQPLFIGTVVRKMVPVPFYGEP